jgi:hypothetical protein
MAQKKLPIAVPGNLEQNLNELFDRLDFIPNENGKAGNFDAEIIDGVVTDTSAFVVRHRLGRAPVGYLIIDKDGAADVYTFSDHTSNQLSLVSDVAGVTIKLLIF